MEKIIVRVGVNQNTDSFSFDLEDLNITTQEWESMIESERKEFLQNAINDLNSQPYWVLDDYSESN